MRRWTEQEERYLVQQYNRQSLAQSAKVLNRTECSVTQKAIAMGITQVRRGENHPFSRYSDHDIALARTLAAEGITPKDISWKLEMGLAAVRFYLRHPDKRPTPDLAHSA